MYNQVQRLGNPLVSEVLLSKRSHPTHGSIGPDQDAALVAPEVVDFLTTVAGRDPAYIQAIAPALIPDVLVVDTSKDPSTAVGWLTWLPQLGGGYGGRQLQDDVSDLALTAVFGSALGDASNATPQLTTDNVGVRLTGRNRHLPVSGGTKLTGAAGRSTRAAGRRGKGNGNGESDPRAEAWRWPRHSPASRLRVRWSGPGVVPGRPRQASLRSATATSISTSAG